MVIGRADDDVAEPPAGHGLRLHCRIMQPRPTKTMANAISNRRRLGADSRCMIPIG